MLDHQQQELYDDSSGRQATAGHSEGTQPAAAVVDVDKAIAAADAPRESSTSGVGLPPQVSSCHRESRSTRAVHHVFVLPSVQACLDCAVL